MANQNLLEIVGFATTREVLGDVILELETRDMKESIIHAFAQVYKWMLNKKNVIDPEYISDLEDFNQKYDDVGLNREEQLKLLEIRQEINRQVLDELFKKQDDFE